MHDDLVLAGVMAGQHSAKKETAAFTPRDSRRLRYG
jgi:hypothetical protein